MKPTTQLKIVQSLVIISLVLSGLSFIAKEKFNTSLYPFSHWKLYTQPIGNDGTASIFRLYGVNRTQDTTQIKNTGHNYYNQDTFYYILYKETRNYKKQKNKDKALNKIHTLGKEIAPSYLYYIVKELEFEPISYYRKQKIQNTKVILTTKDAQ